jgi:hypothetical protein
LVVGPQRWRRRTATGNSASDSAADQDQASGLDQFDLLHLSPPIETRYRDVHGDHTILPFPALFALWCVRRASQTGANFLPRLSILNGHTDIQGQRVCEMRAMKLRLICRRGLAAVAQPEEVTRVLPGTRGPGFRARAAAIAFMAGVILGVGATAHAQSTSGPRRPERTAPLQHPVNDQRIPLDFGHDAVRLGPDLDPYLQRLYDDIIRRAGAPHVH